ncbi:MAG TPA: MmgE/PrpD family protein [Jiangellaceae bacterium]|nr:MmgE/PrpD family protein [Jiangellaceae bacterium]
MTRSSSDPTLVQRLASFAAEQRYSDLPLDVRDSVPGRVLDVLGISAAALPLDTSGAVLSYVRDTGGRTQATAIGLTDRVPAAQAALLNGTLAHSLDYDDTHLPSVLHPSAAVVPAALAAAERSGASGRDLVVAVAVGLEVCVRIGMAGYDKEAGDSLYFARGQHATSICGALGGAAAAALVTGLGADGVADAVGVAASMASGIIEANRTGGTVKRIHCGWAAHAAISAVELVARGLTGPPSVLEGRFGFFQAFLDGRYDATAVTDRLGEEWAVPGIFYKPYPANHFTHCAADAALALRARGVRPSDVETIHVGVAGPTVRTIGEPLAAKQAPETGYQAQFSAPYVVAAGLFGGGGLGLSLDDFTDELARDPERRALMAKVTVSGDAQCDAIYPYQFPAVVTVRLTGGEEIVEEVLTNRGGADRPLTESELAGKFRHNALRTFPVSAVDAVYERVQNLTEIDDAETLLAPFGRSN